MGGLHLLLTKGQDAPQSRGAQLEGSCRHPPLSQHPKPCPAPQHSPPTILSPTHPTNHSIPISAGAGPAPSQFSWSRTWPERLPPSQGVRPPPGTPTCVGPRLCCMGEAAPRSSCIRSSSQSRNSSASC